MTDLIVRKPPEGRICPARAYLASLAPGAAQKGMASALRTILALVQPGVSIDEFPWERLRVEHTAAIRSKLVEKYAPRSVNMKIAALKGVLRVCWRQQLMSETDYRHAIDMKSLTVAGHERAGRRLGLDEARALVRAARTDPDRGEHDAALIVALFYGGLRRAEVCALDADHYEPETGALLVHGKGGKQREIYLPAHARAAFETWWRLREDCGRFDIPIFRYIGKQGLGGRLRVDEVAGVLDKIRVRAGVAPFTAHDFRRTFATSLLDAGVDIETVRRLMGHSNITTTALYDRRGEEAKQTAVDKLPNIT